MTISSPRSEIAARFVASDPGHVRTFSNEHLPPIYRFWYSAGFVRRLHVCFIQVVARLVTDPWVGLACRGEEFVLDALLNQTRILAEMDDLPAEPMAKLEHALAQLAEEAFDDFDYLFAFEPASFGIDDPETEQGYQFGMSMPLHPRYWFEPIGDLPVHPLASGWNTEGDMRSELGRGEAGLRHPLQPAGSQPSNVGRATTLHLRPATDEHWFDCYLMVDWSANKEPKSGADSIWAAFCSWDGATFVEKPPVNCPTRIEPCTT